MGSGMGFLPFASPVCLRVSEPFTLWVTSQSG
jgi:hypothetical protein